MKDGDQNSKFIENLRKIDFSEESENKERNLEFLKMEFKNYEKRGKVMKKGIKRSAIVAATVASLFCVSLVTYGNEFFRVIKSFSIGQHANYIVMEDKREFIAVPPGLEGKLFYENGKEVVSFPPEGALYDAEGQEVQVIFENGSAKMVSMEEFNSLKDIEGVKIYDLNEARSYFIADVLVPSYLPEGYRFDYAEFYGIDLKEVLGDLGKSKYMNIYYTNGSGQLLNMIRFMDDETAFAMTVYGDAEKIMVNGHEAMLNGKNIDIQIGDVMYTYFGGDLDSNDQLIKIVESLK